MLCPKCKREMMRTMRFELNKSYQFFQCECGVKTKNKRIHFEEFSKKGSKVSNNAGMPNTHDKRSKR